MVMERVDNGDEAPRGVNIKTATVQVHVRERRVLVRGCAAGRAIGRGKDGMRKSMM